MIIDGVRNLVTIRTISDIKDIPNADMIKVATIDGWKVVVKTNEFEVGDQCVYFEIDSFLPADNPCFSFLAAKGTKKGDDGVDRVRLRTVKLRGQISQGLALPIDMVFPDGLPKTPFLDEVLNVIKYESEDFTKTVSADVAGTFPVVIPKTDEERCQNIFNSYKEQYKDTVFAKSLKLDGSSITMAFFTNEEHYVEKVVDSEGNYPFNFEDGQFVVCSRNLVLKYEPSNHFWKGVENTQVIQRLREYSNTVNNNNSSMVGKSIAIQGELMGPGIQKNRENFNEHKIFAFRVWFIDEQRFATDEEFHDICRYVGLDIVPQLGYSKPFEEFETVDEMLGASEIPSINNKIAEGIVYKSVNLIDGQMVHFKAINNKFLLKGGD